MVPGVELVDYEPQPLVSFAGIHDFEHSEAHPGADDVPKRIQLAGPIRDEQGALSFADPTSYGELRAGLLPGEVLQGGDMHGGDGADGLEEFSIVLPEEGAGGGGLEKVPEVCCGGHDEEPIEPGEVGLASTLALA